MNLLPVFPKAPRYSAPGAPPVMAVASQQGQPSWISQVTTASPYSYVPVNADLLLYEQLAQIIPILSAAVNKTVDLIGVPYVEGDDETVAEMEQWMDALPVNRIQTGFCCWFQTWCANHLLYGRATAEILLSSNMQEVWGLQELHPRTIQYRPGPDGYNLEIIQWQVGSAIPKLLNRALLLNATHRLKNDNPHGSSILHGIPFVAGIIEKVFKNVGQSWTIYGTPTYHVNTRLPENLSDAKGTISAGIITNTLNVLNNVLKSRYEGDIRHFATAGETSIDIMGPGGSLMKFTEDTRTLLEQVVAATDLPPMILGLQWQAGERIGAEQAKLLSARMDSLRASLGSEILRLFNLRQALTGGKPVDKLAWNAPTLADALQQAQADAAAATAEKQAMENDKSLWKLSFINAAEFARRHREDLKGLDDEEVKAQLATEGLILMDAPPEDPVPQFGGGPPGQPGQPPQLPQRSVTYAGNGNGREY